MLHFWRRTVSKTDAEITLDLVHALNGVRDLAQLQRCLSALHEVLTKALADAFAELKAKK